MVGDNQTSSHVEGSTPVPPLGASSNCARTRVTAGHMHWLLALWQPRLQVGSRGSEVSSDLPEAAQLVSSCSGCHKLCSLGGLNSRDLFSHSSSSYKSKTEISAGLLHSEDPLLALPMALLERPFLCVCIPAVPLCPKLLFSSGPCQIGTGPPF